MGETRAPTAAGLLKRLDRGSGDGIDAPWHDLRGDERKLAERLSWRGLTEEHPRQPGDYRITLRGYRKLRGRV